MNYEFIAEQCSKGVEVFKEATILVDDGNKDSLYLLLAKQLQDLKERFAEQKLTILIAGEVKAGKSTFINKLLGVDILAAAEEVCTNVPTKIVYGEEEKIFVHFSSTTHEPLLISREEVATYSTEGLNQENKRNVEYIEIQINSKILAEGLAFIDTPGLGAIDPLHAIATYRIATKADILFFLGDVRKPLTNSEVCNLKNLVKVSKCEQIVHLLTCCDLNNPDEILAANKKMLEQEFTGHNIPIMKVSSLLYHRYMQSGDRRQFDDSGFQQVRTYISSINAKLKTLLDRRFSSLTSSICYSGYKKLTEIIDTVENPEVKERKVKELEALVERLQEIEDNKTVWSQQLTGKQLNFNEELNSFIDKEQKKIVGNVSENLESDNYLEDKDALSNSISADLIRFQQDLEKKISAGFVELYDWLRTETRLKDIQEQSVQTPKGTSTEIIIDDEVGNVKVGEKIRDVYVATSIGLVVSSAAGSVGAWAGAAAGAKVGAVIGSTAAPGIGTAIGAIIGGVTGVVSGLLVYKGSKEKRKEKQKQETLVVCKQYINDYFNEVRREVKKANIPNSTELNAQFVRELGVERKRIKLQHNTLKNEALRVRANYKAIKELVNDSKNICDALVNNEA